jgi:hypothetical protein
MTSKPFGVRSITAMIIGAAPNPINSSVIGTGLVAIAAAMDVPVGTSIVDGGLPVGVGSERRQGF